MISVTILIKNGERKIKEVLDALRPFEEVLLFDTGSVDNTLQIAASYPNVVIHREKFIGFGVNRNQAASLAKNDWILAVDADEVLSKELVEEIRQENLQATHLYALPFINFFNGREIRRGGWKGESHIRLYNKKKTSFSESLVHEGVISEGFIVKEFAHPLYHYSYETLSDFLVKMERYSTLFADQYKGKRESSPAKAVTHAVGAFLKGYFLKRGFLDGYEGFLIASYNAQTAFYKYLKLYHANK